MARQSAEIALAGIALDQRLSIPLYRQLYNKIRNSILQGQLRNGTRLPASRIFAEQLNVSRNTVTLAFDQLVIEGYLKGKIGSGTYVSDDVPERLLQASIGKPSVTLPCPRPLKLSNRAEVFSRVFSLYNKQLENIRPFQIDVPALDAFPYDVWMKLTNQAWRSYPRLTLEYGDPEGYKPLREALAEYLRMHRAAHCEPDQVIIIDNSQQGVDLVARVLLEPGDGVWMEDPGCIETQAVFLNAGYRVTPIAIDAEGVQVEVGKKKDPKARLVYITPSYQYPLGSTMSLARRLQLLEWVRASRAWVLEDDYDSEFRFVGHPLASLQGLDVDNRVIYLGTLSRILFPSLHLAYMVVPHALVGPLSATKVAIGRQSSIIDQIVLARFIEEGHFGRHIRRVRVLCQERQEALLDAARRELGGLLTIKPMQCGMHLVGRFPRNVDDRCVCEKANLSGVVAHPLSQYCMGKKIERGLLLGFAAFTEREIRKAVPLLAKSLT